MRKKHAIILNYITRFGKLLKSGKPTVEFNLDGIIELEYGRIYSYDELRVSNINYKKHTPSGKIICSRDGDEYVFNPEGEKLRYLAFCHIDKRTTE